MIVDLFMVHQFLKRLAKPFDKWRAYELGIIDAEGNILKPMKSLTRVVERDAFGKFDLMILNLKKALAKLPGGKTRIGTIAAVMYLLKEGTESDSETLNEELFESYILEIEGAGATPSTNTSAIPDTVAKKSPVLKRKVKDLIN